MSLFYKSCIFCDDIFDISTIHVCKIEEPPDTGFHKIDNTPDTNSSIVNDPETTPTIKMSNIKRHSLTYEDIDYCESGTGSGRQTNRNKKAVVNDDLPTQKELYTLLLELTTKYDKLQQEVTNIKNQLSNRLKRDIADYLQYDQRPKYTFLEWVTSFTVTDEILKLVFDTDLTDGVRKCIDDRIESEGGFTTPIRVFKDKPDWIFLYTNEPVKNSNENENKGKGDGKGETEKIKCVQVEIILGCSPDQLLKTPVWRMVPKSSFHRVKDYISEHILKKFYIWEAENEPKMKHSVEKMDILASYMLKVIGHGSKQKKDRQNAELYRWFFSKMAIA